jgi:hypothetical protein
VIVFTQRAEFESAWSHLLTVKSPHAPLVLWSSPDQWRLGNPITAGVRLQCPRTGDLVGFEGANYPPGSEAAIADGKFLRWGPPWPDDLQAPSGSLPEYVVIADGKWRAWDGKEPDGRTFWTLRRARTDLELIVDGDIVDLNRIP